MTRILGYLRLLLWLGISLGIVMHALVRDGVDSLIVVFYILPLPVLLGMTCVLMLHRRHRIPALLVALGLTVSWVARSFSWHDAKPHDPNEVKVLFWNLDRPDQPSKPLIEMIQKLNPDFVACDEPGPHAEEDTKAYKAALPDYDCQYMPRGILWLSKHPSRYRARGKLDNIGAYAVFEAQMKEHTLRIVTVDVYGEPTRPRTAQLKEVLDHTNHDPRVIVMGDFNTPSESRHFDAFRQDHLQDALDMGGRGFRETWFFGLPLLSLDHIWLGKDWQVLEAQKIWTKHSDHAAVFVRCR